MPERRNDSETRDRITKLELRYQAFTRNITLFLILMTALWFIAAAINLYLVVR